MEGKPNGGHALSHTSFYWAILTASTRARPPPTRWGTVRHHPQRLPRRKRRRARGERTFSVRPNACPTPADMMGRGGVRGGVPPPAMRARVSHTAHVDLPAPLRNARTQMPKIPDWARGRRGFGRRDARTARSCVPPAPARRAPRAVRSTVRGAARGGGDVASARAPNSSPRPLRSTRRANRPRVRAPGPLHALRVRLPARGVAVWVVAGRKNRSRRGGGARRRTGGKQASPRASLVHLREVLRARRKTGSKQASP